MDLLSVRIAFRAASTQIYTYIRIPLQGISFRRVQGLTETGGVCGGRGGYPDRRRLPERRGWEDAHRALGGDLENLDQLDQRTAPRANSPRGRKGIRGGRDASLWRRRLETRRRTRCCLVHPCAGACKAASVSRRYFWGRRRFANVGGRRRSLRVVRARSRAPEIYQPRQTFSLAGLFWCGAERPPLTAAMHHKRVLCDFQAILNHQSVAIRMRRPTWNPTSAAKRRASL